MRINKRIKYQIYIYQAGRFAAYSRESARLITSFAYFSYLYTSYFS